MTDHLLDLIRVRTAGMTWRQVLVVRDVVDDLLNAEISRKQAQDLPAARTTPVASRPAAPPRQESA
jgi:hypothetical protein